ncbi:MAG: strawberry notch C-terminal domain-containing protein [Bacteroidales bacterium]|nr:strawberry notch C-terminal domain-containing protein [Bacteroidales bacterium]
MNDNKDKIKKLYDTFVSDGYEMESEEQFRKNLQDVGKRKAAYDALVNDGYEMEAYDQFEKNLGFGTASTPAPKTEPATSSTKNPEAPQSAKPKGTPLSEADKARMSTEINTTMRRTQQMAADFNDRMSNMMEYGINLGQQTKKSKMQYNPSKRKFEQTYITPAGNRYTSKAIADTESFQYRQAADMSVSGQLRRATKQRDEIEKRMGEIAKEEDTKNDSPLAMLADAGNVTGGNVYYSQTLPNKRYANDEYKKLHAALTQVNERIRVLQDEYNRNHGDDVGFWRGVSRGLGSIGSSVLGDAGFSDMMDASAMLERNNSHTEGEKKASDIMMEQTALNQAAQQEYGGNYQKLYGWGVMAGEMPAFMVDFVLTGGGYDALNIFGKQGVKLATKAVGKKAVEEMAKQGFKRYVKNNGLKGLANEATNWTIKALGTTADDLLVRAPLMTNTVQAGKTAADIIDRKLGDVVVDENGNYDFSNDKTWGNAIWQGEANSIIENYSEMFGAHLDPVVTLGNMSKLANVVGAKRLSGVLAKADAQALGGIMGQTQQMFNKMGVSDYVGEVAEEYYGQLWRTMLNLDDAYVQTPDGTRTNLLATKDFHGDIWGGMALSMGLMGAAKHTFNAVQYASMRHGVNKSDARVGELLGKDIWEPLKATLDLTTNENFGDVAEAIVNDKDFTDKEKAAVLDYMERSMIMRGYNLASMAQSRGGEQDPNKQQLNESYLNGYEATSSQERNDAKNMLEYQRQRVEQALTSEDLQMIDNWDDGVAQADNTEWTDEQRDAVNDYLNTKQVYDGMKQRIHDDVDAEVENSNAMVDARVNTDTGMIQGATMKQDDRKVYIVSGNVVTYPDGTGVDLQASDQSIIVRDAETDELEQVAPDAVFSVDEAIDPNQAKAEAESVIVESAAQKFANEIDGTITLEAGNTFDVVDEDGRQASVTITPNADGVVDNGDGTVNVSMDNTNVVPIPVSALQEMVDAANMARVAQFEEQRAIENAQVKATEQEATRPQYALNDEVTLRDENGNSVRGSISADVDDDGKYEVYTEDPINGFRVNLFSRDELDDMLVEHNGEVIEQPIIVPESAEVAESTETDNNDTKNIPENGNIVEENILTAPQHTALERIPKDEQGQPIYEQTDSDTAWDAIVEQTEGDEAIAQSVADAMLADKEAELKKLEKAKPKGGVTIADKIAAEKERKAAISAAQDVVSVWKKIAGTSQRRKQEADLARRKEAEEQAAIRRAEEEKLRAEREEAERIEREALNGVPDMVDDKPQDARARGYRRVTGTKIDRQQPLGAKKGKNVQVRFSDSDIADGSVALINADQLQPSHVGGVRNPLHFIDEAQPKERNDDASKMSSRKIAANMRPEEITSSVTAYTGAPTVNSRGEVIQGNNRSDALRQMWQSEPEQATKYKQYLTDHAEEFGLDPADIEAMERPVLVNMLDVDDNKAIELGQFVAQDTESGGTERIKPKNAVQKIGGNMGSFANLLLRSADDETSFSGLVDTNGVDVLKWMSGKGYITPTQYQSAFDSKGNLTAEAKNDLKGIMYQSIFKGGSTRLEEMFNTLPAKAQKTILATAYRDYDSPNAERMVEEIQNSIRAFYALMQDATFVEAKNYKDVRLAIEGWKRQYQMDDVTGESYLPAEYFSNFALNLAALYKGESQSLIQATFNKMFDLIQGTQEETLFEKPDNTPRSLAQAIKETLNIDYNGQQRNNVLAGDSTASQDGQGSRGASEAGERSEDGNGTADRAGGTESGSGQDETATNNGGERLRNVDRRGNMGHLAERQGGLDETGEIDENGIPFVRSPKGKYEFGTIDENTGLTAAPIKLSSGFQDENGKGYGLRHIEANHGKQIRAAGFSSVEEFVSYVAENYDEENIRVGKRREGINSPTYLLQVTDKHDNTLFVELSKDGSYWNVNSAGIFRKGYSNKKETVAKTEPQQPNNAVSDGSSLSKDEQGGMSSDEPNGKPTVSVSSAGKVTNNSRKTSELGEKIAQAEAKTEQNPTKKQKEAGNYKKGHVQIGAFDVTIENPKGSVRSGVDANGNKWETEMHNTYGYIRGTEGVDGDHIDVFLADNIDSWDGRKVFVIDQYNEDGSFDEHKVMFGFNNAEDAYAAYLSNYEKGWENTHKIMNTPANLEDFEKWIDSSHRKTKPFVEYSDVKKKLEAEQKQNLSNFKVGDVVRDYYTNRLYRIKKFTKTGLCTIAELDSSGNETASTTFNADNNPRFSKAEVTATTSKEDKQEKSAVAKVNVENLFGALNTKGETKLSDHATPIEEEAGSTNKSGYSVEPAQYTTKRGKVLDMQLVKFDRELSKDEVRNAKTLAKELKGWYDKEKGGFMMRTTEDAQKLADAVMDESGESLEDAAPLSLNDVKETSGIEKAEATQGATSDKQEAPADDIHKLVTNERYEQLKKRMLAKMNQLNMGIDPEMLAIGTEMAVYHIEGGARKFAQYAKAMIEDLGDAIRPYLKSFYNAVRDLPEAQELANSMDSYDDVAKFDVANFDKASINALATAEMVVAESEAEEQATEAKEAITNQRNTERRQKNEQTKADTETIAKKAASVASKAESVAETSKDTKELNRAAEQIDEALAKVNDQLALLGYYEADPVENDFNEANGYMHNAEKKAVADAVKLAKQLVADLGLNIDKVTGATTANRSKRKNVVTANIAPAGGDIVIRLPLSEGSELYMNIVLEPSSERGLRTFAGDNLMMTRFMYRVEGQDAKRSENIWIPSHLIDDNILTYAELLRRVSSDVKPYIQKAESTAEVRMKEFEAMAERDEFPYTVTPEVEKQLAESKKQKETDTHGFKVGDKVLFKRNDGKNKWEEATIVDFGGGVDVTLDTGNAPIMYEAAKFSQIKPSTEESVKEEPKPKKKQVSSQTLIADLFGGTDEAEATEQQNSEENATPVPVDASIQRKFALAVKDDMLSALDTDTKPYRSIIDLRKRASELGMEVDNDGRTDILLQELVEDGLVRAARKVIAKYGRDSRESYDLVCKLYDMQPTIAARSSNRIKMQQYSTPLPMSWIADRFAMESQPSAQVLEPTAGNGMLVFTIPVKQVHVNELDETRLDNLREQGFAQVTQQDATEPFEGDEKYDAVIANPPFGKREAVEYDGKMIPGLDPQITLNALASMKDEGRAAIIIGGNMEYASNGGLKGLKPFFTYLYDHYNVSGVINMDGKLYAKQGTTFPTRMILINGRRSEEERAQTAIYPPVQSKALRKAESFEDLYEILNEVLNSNEKTNGTEILRSRERKSAPVNNQPSGRTDGEGHREQSRKDDTSRRGERGERTNVEQSPKQSEGVLRGERRENTGNGEDRNTPTRSERGDSGRSNEPDTKRVAGVGVSPNRVGLKTEQKKRTLTEEKLSYRPHNGAFSLNSVAPAAMVEAMDNVLSQIEQEYGSIDEFIKNELGYATIEDAHAALAAEQMDSVAMAIYQMKKGQALIIGDQTGVGKGRQMAALIRWAVMRGEKPVFITQKADLFSDIYRDLVDVGSGDLKPFIFNSDGAMVDAKGNAVHKPLSQKEMAKVLASVELPDEYDFAVLTYSQVNTGDAISQQELEEAAKKRGARVKKSKASKEGKATPKATFLRTIANDNYLFLDESHTAAGSSNTGAYLQSILRSAKAATFASATFAKRPDTMPLYAIRTAMSQAKVEPDKMIGIIEKGGVTLQEIMSRELTNAGQMVRRERDMSDVKTDWKTINDPATIKRARENYDKTIAAFNAIIKFQENYVKPKIEELDMELAITAESAGVKRGTDKMGVENVPFASKTYNYTKQLMLALKVDAIADEVEAEINAGRHPVIALESTMESTIKDYSAGDVIAEPTFSASLLKGLDSVMQYTVKDEDGNESHAYYTPKQLGEAGEKAYYELQQFISESTSGIFISPLDAIIERLHEKGYKVGELTGRNMYVERNAKGEVVVKRRTDKDKKKMQREFNDGTLDVLILNKSASTGISLHASERFSDQRQRTMIIAQPLSDINDYMQMIGRIDRTGQVHRGYYINLGLPVPAENRFLMMLSTKLKSLNANTTTSQDSDSNEVEAPDLLNKYGSQVVVEYLRDNVDVYEKMCTPLKKAGAGAGRVQASELDEYKPQEDDARKVTGYVALLSTKEQEEFYDDVVRRYNELIKYLNDTGSNDLKISVMPLRATTLDKRVSSEGIDPNGSNPFARNSYVEKVEMDVLRKPMKAEEVKKVISQINNGNADGHLQSVKDTIHREDKARIAAENERYEKAKAKAAEDIAKQTEKINRQQKRTAEEKSEAIARITTDTNERVEAKHQDNMIRLNSNSDQLLRRLDMFEVGGTYLVPETLESMVFDFASPAIFCGYKTKDKKITASTTFAVFATLDGRRRVEVKLSDGTALTSIDKMTNDNWDSARSTTLDNWDAQIPNETRKQGFIMTGNILQAIADTQDEHGGYPGQLISYTDIDGNVHDGILMPDKWNASMLKTSGAPISSRLQQIKQYETVTSSDGKVRIEGSSWSNMHYITVPKSKKDGAQYYENADLLKAAGGNFYPYRGQLRADIPASQIDKVVAVLSRLGVKIKGQNEDELSRNGDGTYSDDALSYENDPIAKWTGKSPRSKAQRKAFAERERQRMVERVNELVEKLGLDNVEVVTDASTLEGKKQRAKGFYSKSIGKITIVIPNHVNVFDVEQTLLHEAVAHYGLRQLFGEHFDTFLDNVFNNADESIRREIVEMAKKHDWYFRTATEEYLAGLAENTDFEHTNASWWSKIKSWFLDMLHNIGFEGFSDVTLTDNELRYILWRSYENLADPGRYRSILGEAEDVAKQQDLKVGNYQVQNSSSQQTAVADDALFRDGDPKVHERVLARDRYEQRVKRGWYQTQEALQDSMLGLREAMEAMLKADRKHGNIEDVSGFENAYLGENRLSSTNKAEADAFAHLLFKPMLDEVANLAHTEAEREELTDYMMAKHGLERNIVMAERDFNKYISETPNGTKTLDDFRARDYAGLTALTGMDDVADAEAEAQAMVASYESRHDTTDLWDKVNAVNAATLSKTYECGMMSKETYESVKSMYEYYIPLRGFDEKTSNEAYAYLTDKHSAFNAPIKKAHGRSSKADDPFANMQSMAEGAITQGNRNKLVKQRFLNFVLNHPSDLASVSDLWIQYDDVTDEWKPVFPDNIETTDTPDEVEKKMNDFNERMKQLAESKPDKYKRGKDAVGIPYRVVESGDLRQHQIVVKRNGRDYIITINGNPRAAQAINGQTNPDNDMSGAIGAVLRGGEKINRQLSAFYTTRNPDFVISNFMRDMLYTNTMVWVKESPNYALRFHRNVALANPARLKILLAKHRKGELDMSDPIEKMFHQFMVNGGETGYANIRDIEQHKNDIRRELKKANGKISVRRAWDWLGERFDEYNRAVENCARFAAFITSRQFGRSIDRAIYDAKDISVNFNKKGSGAKFYDAVGQTRAGNVSSLISGLGRSGFVFWNAAIQGTTNFGRQTKRHPAKALTAMATMFILGALMAYLNGDDDDDDKNAYYNLPDHVRRSNLLFRAGEHWISLPLPQEYRAIYGMGELMSSVLSGKEHYTDGELAEKIMGQMTQVFPLDIMEGGGGLGAFIPSSVKPLAEAYVMEKSWTGMPLYKNTPYNKDMPEWTKAYKSANKYIVGLAETMNEATGGDPYTKGAIDINPAKVEYMLNGYFGGVFSTIDKMVKTGETFFGDREYDPRSVLLVNRLLKAGDERTEFRAINNEYFRLKNEHDIIKNRLKHYEDDTDNGVFDYAEKIDFLYNSPEFARYEIFEDYRKDIEDLTKELKEAADEEEYKEVELELNALKKEMILEMNETRNRK